MRTIIEAGAAVVILLASSAALEAQCSLFMPASACSAQAPARGGRPTFIVSELQAQAGPRPSPAPEVRPVPAPDPANPFQQASAVPSEPADCRMRVLVPATEVDPRIARAPAPDMRYAIRSKPAPACPSSAVGILPGLTHVIGGIPAPEHVPTPATPKTDGR